MKTDTFTTPHGAYHVESYGNGWAYSVTCQATGDNLWFQDSDAEQLQQDSDGFTNEDALRSYFDCLCE